MIASRDIDYTMEIIDDQNIKDGPLVVRFHPGKLTDLATISFVASLLRFKIMYMCQNGGKGFLMHAENVAQVSIPNLLRKTINELDEGMEMFIAQWWGHHFEYVFFQNLPADSMIDWLDKLVWLPDGTINYGQTARKLLDGDLLTNVQKFQLACEYCFVDDVKRLKQTLTQYEIEKATGGCDRLNDPFLNYWCYKHFSIRFLPVDKFDIFYEMIIRPKSRYYDNWLCIKYALQQLDEDNEYVRVDDAVGIIYNQFKPRLTLHYLLELSGAELNLVFESYGASIMEILPRKRQYFEHTLKIWKRMVLVLGDSTVAIVIHNMNDLANERSYVNSLLWEIWLATSESQKKFIVDQGFCNFIEEIVDPDFNEYFCPNFPLILDVLSRYKSKRRYQYWLAHWPYLVVGQLDHRDYIDRIMKLCIEDDQQVEVFKRTVMTDYDSIANYCNLLIRNKRVKEIPLYLEFCTSDPLVIRDLKKKIMTMAPKETIFFFIFHRAVGKAMADFIHYLDNIFTENESKDFFNQVVRHENNMKEMVSMMDIPGRLEDSIEFVEKYVSSDETLAEVKHYFFETYRCQKKN